MVAVARHTLGTADVSQNAKIGPVYATYRALGTMYTCVDDCVYVGRDDALCYADSWRVGSTQRRARLLEIDVAAYIQSLPGRKDGRTRGVRHLVSGDLFIDGAPDVAYIAGMVAGHIARPDTYGWGYTHGWRRLQPGRVNGASNCTINASCDTPADIPVALAAGWAAVMVVAPDAPAGIVSHGTYAVLTCPQQTGRATCDTCRMCAYGPEHPRRTWRGLPVVIGFRAHDRVAAVGRALGQTWKRATG